MPYLDRYILRQTFTAFMLFCLILAGVIWLTQAVRLIDVVLSSGQSLFLLVEFSVLVLPRVLSMVVPLAGFAAVIYVINKLYSEAELVVMMMSGQSPFSIARPVLWFALGLSFVTLGITNFLAPMGELRLENNRNEIRSELANALIREGRFLHPTDGLTVFIREASETGNMAGLFLHDERDPARPVTYTAERALLLRDGPIARLIMSRGVALTFSAGNDLLARVQFDEFTYDLSDLVSTVDTEPAKASTLMTWQLISPDASVEALARFKRGAFMATGHERIVFGVHALLMPLLALGVMLTGGYQRRGFSKRIIAAVLSGVTLVVAGLVVKGAVISNPGLWPVSYLPDVIAGGLIVFLLNRATTTRSSAAPV